MIPSPSSDRYELSPLQEGMLFHALDARDSGVDIEQVAVHVEEDLDVPAFRRAWERVVARHAVLRTRFRWEGLERPRQEVCPSAALPLSEQDWSRVPAGEQEGRWVELSLTERQAGFDLSVAPVMRLVVVRRAPGRTSVLWSFHHILLDGRSFPIVLREVFALYDGERAGRAPQLGSPRPYRDYIEWLRSVAPDAGEGFWRELLRRFTAPNPLPLARTTARPGAGVGTEALELQLTRAETGALSAFAAGETLTTATLLQAAWALVLHGCGAGDDIVFGATRAGRHTVPGSEDMVGLFINTLPVRVRLTPELGCRDLLAGIRAQNLALRAHEHTPLVKVLGWSEIPRGQGLFDTVLVYDHRTLHAALEACGVAGEQRRFEYRGQTNFPLTLIGYGGDELLLRLEYDRHRFDADDIRRLLGHLRTVLVSMPAAVASETRAVELPLLTAEEEHQVLNRWNPRERFPVRPCLHRIFEAQVARTPDAVAVVCGEQRLTYRELNRRANGLAVELQRLGAGPEVLIGLHMERSVETVVGILGILKSGGAYVPLDPSYPPERLRFMAEDARMPLVVSRGDAAVAWGAARPVDLDALGGRDETPASGVEPGHPAYVIYTSGSTGTPKGVRVTHRNVERLFAATERWFGFDERDVWTLFHSYAFDFSVWELWGALLHGGRLVVVPYWVSRSPDAFLELLSRERVTVLNQTPSAFRQLIQTDAEAPGTPLALRLVVFGGEALELQSLKPWFDRRGDRRPQLVNMYGITETTVHVTYRPIGTADLEAGCGSVIGEPIPDLQVYVLDRNRRPAPIGVPGELYVGGDGVALGYLNREALTAERFLPDPFGPGGGRLYRTGDLARRLAGGDLEYLGRIDHQVKIRGFRIELGEIEACINQQPGVRESVVIPREDRPGEKRLAAYVVADGDPAEGLEPLRRAVAERLPDYMVPSAFVRLDVLPLNENGKVDRKRLPAPDYGRSDAVRTYTASRTPAEERMVGIWAAVLRVERVGVDDNFFELGGDSILAIQVISRCRQAGWALTPRDLFRHPTVAELTAAAGSGEAAPHRETGPAETGPIPLTPIQRWFFEQAFADPHHWNQAFLFETAADTDPERLERALQAVIRRHDAFGLRFERRDAEWMQRLDPAEPPALVRENLADLAPPEQRAALTAACARLQAGFDLAVGPLVRCAHFHLGAGRPGRLLIAAHHLAVDGVSWSVLVHELDAAYANLASGDDPGLPPATTAYAGWARALAAYARSGQASAALAHWLGAARPGDDFGGSAIIPADDTEAAQAVHTTRLPAEETDRLLRAVPAALRARANDILLTALGRAVAAPRGRTIRFDLEGHGREEIVPGVDLTRTVGWFTTIYPVRLELDPGRDTVGTLALVREQLARIPDGGVSYGVLRYLRPSDPVAGPLRGAAAAPILFNYLGQMDTVTAGSRLLRFADEPTGPWHSPRARRAYPLEVLAQVIGGVLEVRWLYHPARHPAAEVARMADRFTSALHELIAAAGARGREDSSADPPAEPPDVEASYGLSPMQRLFYSVEAATPGAAQEQWHFRLRGPVRPETLRRAWERLTDRHAVLRSAFLEVDGQGAVQTVHRAAYPEWTEHDWRALAESDREHRLSELLQADRDRPLNLSTPPILRLAFIRWTGAESRLIWTTHHIAIDGWSWTLVFRDLSQVYTAMCEGREPPPVDGCRYRDYIDWLLQPRPEIEAFWRRELRGVRTPTPIAPPGDAPNAPTAAAREAVRRLTPDVGAELQAFARAHRLTLNTIVQGAWAVVLSHWSGDRDVVFGAAFAGRPPEVPGVEAMVGPCVNNVPVRVAVRPEMHWTDWLRELQERQFEIGQHQYASPAAIQAWSEVPWRLRLFDSLLVFQNYIGDDATRRLSPEVAIETLAVPEQTSYPLTLTVTPGRQLQLKVIWPEGRFDAQAVESLLAQLAGLLSEAPRQETQLVSRLLHWLPQGSAGRARSIAERSRSDAAAGPPPASEIERTIAGVWQELFQVERVGVDVNFFDLGGHSLLLMRAHKRLRAVLDPNLPIVALLQCPTIRSLAARIARRGGGGDAAPRADAAARPAAPVPAAHPEEAVAIIAMTGRFPGAPDLDRFWRNLRDGVESIRRFGADELEPAGPEEMAARGDARYVRARGILEGVEEFDPGFFGMSPREAAVTDPQHRAFLELAWEALECAGYPPQDHPGRIGVFAGMSNNTYYLNHLHGRRDLLEALGALQIMMGNEKDYLATRVSYKLNLRGPSLNIYTACSTSLVAVCQAVFSLLAGHCDLALAGGVSITLPQRRGYLCYDGAITSPDGRCRSYDAAAQGTVFSNGVGIVVLKRLSEALADRDTVLAVIRGAALNNDGSAKVSFMAPSVDGQAGAIAEAQRMAGVDPASISYLEGHGTATPLGDPVEIAGLTQAFRAGTDARGFCALGSVKSNIGHLDAAAGIAGLIKTVLALQHRQIPPSLHFTAPNPKLELDASPFYVNTRLREWTAPRPRRAGVSSFGVGGTNAHVVLEEAPDPAPVETWDRPGHLIVLSARTESALAAVRAGLADHLENEPRGEDIADVAYTLQVGRHAFAKRAFVVAADREDAVRQLRGQATPGTSGTAAGSPPSVVFVFPGQGSQTAGMGRGLYETLPLFRETVDTCAAALHPDLGCDLRAVLFAPGDPEEAAERLRRTQFAQTAIFVIEYALARVWEHWGVVPDTWFGHSVGEFVAATLAGVFRLEDALHLVAVRGRLMQEQPPGAMLSVRLPAQDVRGILPDSLDLAAVNAPRLCVVSGPTAEVDAFADRLARDGVPATRLQTSHAFHSRMMDPVVEPFAAEVRRVGPQQPSRGFISTVTGRPITAADAVDPLYWAGHLRATVRFADAVRAAWQDAGRILLEVGPRHTATTLAKQTTDHPQTGLAVASLEAAGEGAAEWGSLLHAAGRLWTAGVPLRWDALSGPRRRMPLPTYPFERVRCWVDPPMPAQVRRIFPAAPAATPPPPAESPVPLDRVEPVATKGPPMTAEQPLPAAEDGRLARTVAAVQALIEDATGIALQATDPRTSFTELGLDSLALTQCAQLIRRDLGVEVSFRQLIERLTTVAALAAHIEPQVDDTRLPGTPAVQAPAVPAAVEAEPAPPVPPTATYPVAAAPPAAAPSAGLPAGAAAERVVAQQLELMVRQLELLQRAPAGVRTPLTTPAPASTAAAAPPAAADPSDEPRPRKMFGPGARIERTAVRLPAAEQQALEAFMRRYTDRTAGSKRFAAEHRAHLADPRAVSGFKPLWKEMVYPIVVERSEGARLWDVDGNEYVDLICGFGADFLGHRPPEVVAAVRAQLDRGFEIGPQHPLVGEAAERLCALTGHERAAFCNTGSEAVLGAVRAARTVTGRDRIVTFAGDYHGIFDEFIVRPGRRGAVPGAPGIPASAVANHIVLEYGDPGAFEVLRKRAGEIAAVLVEPIQSRRPDFQPHEFVRRLRAETETLGMALIFDEVITGFRLAPRGAQEVFGVQADLATYGKIIGGGLPIGAIAGSRRFMDALDGGEWRYGDDSVPEVGVTYFAGTFVRHPLALAAARAALDILARESPGLQARVNALNGRLVSELASLFERHDAPFRVAACSSWFVLHCPEDIPHGNLIYFWLRAKGVHLYEGRVAFLTGAHTDADVEFVRRAFEESLLEMRAAGLLPAGSRDAEPAVRVA